MNYSIILYILGCVLKFESGFLLLPAFVGFLYGETEAFSFIFTAAICFILGYFLSRKKPASKNLFIKEGFVTVASSWVLISLLGAIPFVLTGDIPNYVDALFETISGFTTTGSSILSDVEALSKTGLFWRSFTHWVGGMGVLVFIMAILPLMGGSTMNLMKAESTGPAISKLVPHVKDTAKILYGLYIGLTITEIFILRAFHMPFFDALTITFGTVGTGGFGVLNSSLGSYSPLIQYTVTCFLILSGINYTAYFYMLSFRFKEAFRIEEVRWYLFIIALSTGVITFNIRSMYPTWEESFRHASHQVATIITTAGFSTTNFDLWPELSKCILVILMFIGACSGSTAGGMKISRVVMLAKTVKKELSLIIHPREVRKIRIDGHVVEHQTLRNTNVFFVVYFIILLSSTLLLSIDNYDFTTNFTATVATLNNIGPGLAMVGPAQNFSIYSTFSKFILMFNMLAGRLELFPLVIMMLPSTWKRK
ncbi:MAG: TrkH family potassium uptake protein [Roseburia sp.]|nr:TrkH family potassium uptake protein [Roseburia sp.]